MLGEAVHNLLIASDFHLTMPLGPEDEATDQEIILFLRHYARHRDRGRPWRLILAGDTFDFVFPGRQVYAQRYEGQIPPRPQSRKPGSYASVDEAVWRLHKTVREHQGIFVALADFVAAGNRVEILKGNHDVELQWSEVRRALLDEMCKVLEERNHQLARAQVLQGIDFHDWFYYEPGRVYIEHGSQYDEHNAFPDFLDPALVRNPRTAFLTLGSRMNVYLKNSFVEYRPGPSPDSAAFMGYLLRTGQLFSRLFWRRSMSVLRHSLASAGLFSEEGWKADRARRTERLLPLAEESGIEHDKLVALEQLQATPVTAIRGFFFNRMLLDRLLTVLLCLTVLALAIGTGVFPLTEPALLAVLPATAAAIAGAVALGQRRSGLPRWYGWVAVAAAVAAGPAAFLLAQSATIPGTMLVTLAAAAAGTATVLTPLPESMNLRRHLQNTARRIQQLLDVPLVVLAHHHLADEQPVAPDGKARYFNTGAWVSSGPDRNHCHATIVETATGEVNGTLIKGAEYLTDDGGGDET